MEEVISYITTYTFEDMSYTPWKHKSICIYMHMHLTSRHLSSQFYGLHRVQPNLEVIFVLKKKSENYLYIKKINK